MEFFLLILKQFLNGLFQWIFLKRFFMDFFLFLELDNNNNNNKVPTISIENFT